MKIIDVAENRFSRAFMDGRVTITVWPNTPTTRHQDPFYWCIKFQNKNGTNYKRNIPGVDIYSILPDLARGMSQDTAIVIYEALGRWFNETLAELQMEMRWPIEENIYTISNVTQIAFPPKEYFNEELRLIEIEKWRRLHPHIYGESFTRDVGDSFRQMRDYTITVWATPQNDAIADCANYLTSEEYERKKANGELNPNTAYLVFNQ